MVDKAEGGLRDDDAGQSWLLGMAHPYALDALDSAEQAAIEARLLTCEPATRAEFENIVWAVRESFARTAPATATPPPPQLRDRLLAALDATEQDGALNHNAGTAPGGANSRAPDETGAADTAHHIESTPGDSGSVIPISRARRRSWLAPLAVAAAAAVLAVGGVAIYQSTMRSDSPSPQAAPAGSTPAAHAITVALTGGGTVTVDRSSNLNELTARFHDMPKPPKNHVYQMWLIAAQTPRSAGLLADSDMQPDHALVMTGTKGAEAFAISVEPMGGSPTPTTTPVAVVALT